MMLLAAGFAAPLLMVFGFSFMPAFKTFSFAHLPTAENYEQIFRQTYYQSFLWALFLAAITVILLLVICYPLAYRHGQASSGAGPIFSPCSSSFRSSSPRTSASSAGSCS